VVHQVAAGELLQAVPVGIAVFDAESFVCIYANGRAEKYAGAGRLDGQDLRRTALWEGSGLGEAYGRVRKSGGETSLLVNVTTTTRGIDWLECTLLSRTFGGRECMLLTILDLKEEQRQARQEAARAAETELWFGEATAWAMLNASPDSAFLIEPDGRVLATNAVSAMRLGRGIDDIIDRNVYSIWPRGVSEERQRHIAHVVKSGEPSKFEDKDGGRTIHNTVFPILDDGGAVARLAVFGRDITEERQREEELRRSNRELEQFAYVASHDLQEPLRTVSAYTQLLEKNYKGRLGEDAEEFIRYIVDGAGRMRTMILDLLAFSRVGTRQAASAPVDMEKCLIHARANLKLAIDDSGAVVTNERLPHVKADGVQMTQLIQNLMDNAVKFRKPGVAPRLHLSAVEEGDSAVFSLSDNGIGIEQQYFDRIFVIFQRLNSRTMYRGTGMGLAICRRIVERHNGRIWVESAPGEGSTFRFTLPKA
jgi:PAS domain S-box-containing protein